LVDAEPGSPSPLPSVITFAVTDAYVIPYFAGCIWSRVRIALPEGLFGLDLEV
jgi:uncharacterized lipoprotein YbaY